MTRQLTIREAMERLTFVRWWVEGLCYGRPAAMDEGTGSQVAIGGFADNVRELLAGVFDRSRRTLEPEVEKHYDGRGSRTDSFPRDGGLFVITGAELERIEDGLLIRHGRHPTPPDRNYARETIARIRRDIRNEAARYDHRDDLPF